MNLDELWSPRTDGGVVAQFIVTVLLVTGLVWLVRRERSLVLLVVGLGTVVLAWYGFRGLH